MAVGEASAPDCVARTISFVRAAAFHLSPPRRERSRERSPEGGGGLSAILSGAVSSNGAADFSREAYPSREAPSPRPSPRTRGEGELT